MDIEKKSESCICEALIELKSLQDFLVHSPTKYFGNLLAKIAGTDTIPFLLMTKDGFFSHTITVIHENGEKECFESKYFRIESIDKERCCVFLTVLRPLNFKGEHANEHCQVIKLVKTSECIEIDLSCICAIQILDTELLKRQIIIEPKW
jgi:hypothetical protein